MEQNSRYSNSQQSLDEQIYKPNQFEKFPPYLVEGFNFIIVKGNSYRNVICRFLIKYSNSFNNISNLIIFVSYFMICNFLDDLQEQNENRIVLLIILNNFISILYTFQFIFNILYLRSFYFNPYYYGILSIFIDCLAGPIAILITFQHYIINKRFGYYGDLLRFLKLFTLKSVRILIAEINYIVPKCFSLIFSLFFIFYIYSFIGRTIFHTKFPQYFGSMSDSLLTMFQVLTQDNWNSTIVQPITKSEGFFSSFFFIFFLIIMYYISLNIFLGILVAYYDNQEIQHNMEYDYNKDQKLNTELQNFKKKTLSYKNIIENLKYKENNISDSFMKFCSQFIFYYWFLSITANYLAQCYIQLFDFYYIPFYECIEMGCGIIFTLHLVLQYYASETFKNIEILNYKIQIRKYIFSPAIFLDIVSGPIALIIDIIELHVLGVLETGPILRIFKLLNTYENKRVSVKIINIFPQILPSFILVIVIIYYYSFITTMSLKYSDNYGSFGNYHQSFLTLIQIMTLDSWSLIARESSKENPYAILIIVSFSISIFNRSTYTYFFLNQYAIRSDYQCFNLVRQSFLLSNQKEILQESKKLQQRIDIDLYMEIKEEIDSIFQGNYDIFKKKNFSINYNKELDAILQSFKQDKLSFEQTSSVLDEDNSYIEIQYKDKIFKISSSEYFQ